MNDTTIQYISDSLNLKLDLSKKKRKKQCLGVLLEFDCGIEDCVKEKKKIEFIMILITEKKRSYSFLYNEILLFSAISRLLRLWRMTFKVLPNLECQVGWRYKKLVATWRKKNGMDEKNIRISSKSSMSLWKI